MHISHLLPDLSFNMDDLELARFVHGKYGKIALLDKEGHVFRLNRRNGTKGYWTCREYYQGKQCNRCEAKAITRGLNVLIWNGEHNHNVVEPSNKLGFETI